MSDDPSHFGDDTSPAPDAVMGAPTPIAASQVDLLRKARDARGVTFMVDRQQAIESAAEHPIE